MCEQFVARSSEPFRLDELWPFTESLERYGITGFGWGAAWVVDDGAIDSYRDVRAFLDDPGRDDVGAVETTSALVHLRRPSRLSTLTLADTQPFLDPEARFAFSHNGELRHHRELRARYRAEGRIHGRADTEVGERWLEDAWEATIPPTELLCRLHVRFGGVANLALLEPGGAAHAYAGNPENPVFTFQLGRIGIASTGIYSLDRSLFRLVAPAATARRMVRVGHAITLDRNGGVAPAS